MNKNFSLTAESDFDNFIVPYLMTKVDTMPSTNQYTWDDTLQAVRYNCDTTKKCAFSVRLGYLKKGDKVYLEAETMSISGSYPRIYLDDGTNILSYGSNTLVYTQSNKKDGFDLQKLSFTIPKDGFYVASLGNWTSDTAQALVRNMRVNVESGSTVNKQFALRDIRATLVEVLNGVPAMKQYWSNDKVTFEISGSSLIISWDQPLLSKDRPIGFVSTYQMSGNVIAIVQDSTNNEVYVQFYDLSTNTILQVANVTKCVFPVQSIGGM